jgi:DNA-binding transcriptional LysR family regulator
MHINDVDLNLLRVFDAVYSTRNVSRAAERLGVTQPAASQGLMRLRTLLGDALFVRAPGGVAPTPRAERLAVAVQQALGTLEQALSEASQFDPLLSEKTFRLHLSDIGEARFLPSLMAALRIHAPGIRLSTMPLPHSEVAAALDAGKIDFALGFLPSVTDTQRATLLTDRYIVLVRAGHPFFDRTPQGLTPEKTTKDALCELYYAAVRSHSETLRILQLLKLDDRLRLTAAHFLALPAIVKETDLGVLMPFEVACGFVDTGGYAIIEPTILLQDFTVSLHWSRRFESDASNAWIRRMLISLFARNGDSIRLNTTYACQGQIELK